MSETSRRKPHLRPVGDWTDEEVTYRVTREMDGFADIFSSEDAIEGVRQNAARAMDCTDRYEVDELLRSILRTATTILAVWRVRHIWDNPPKAEELIDDEAGPSEHGPAAVRAVGAEAMPEHERAVERWLDAHRARRSA